MIEWKDEGNRLVALSGEMQVGFIFRDSRRPKQRRYRFVFGKNGPVDDKAPDEEQAKGRIIDRFDSFMAASGLMPRAPAVALAKRTIKYVGTTVDPKMECDNEMRELARKVLLLADADGGPGK